MVTVGPCVNFSGKELFLVQFFGALFFVRLILSALRFVSLNENVSSCRRSLVQSLELDIQFNTAYRLFETYFVTFYFLRITSFSWKFKI
jgi:hypothetical protein